MVNRCVEHYVLGKKIDFLGKNGVVVVYFHSVEKPLNNCGDRLNVAVYIVR